MIPSTASHGRYSGQKRFHNLFSVESTNSSHTYSSNTFRPSLARKYVPTHLIALAIAVIAALFVNGCGEQKPLNRIELVLSEIAENQRGFNRLLGDFDANVATFESNNIKSRSTDLDLFSIAETTANAQHNYNGNVRTIQYIADSADGAYLTDQDRTYIKRRLSAIGSIDKCIETYPRTEKYLKIAQAVRELRSISDETLRSAASDFESRMKESGQWDSFLSSKYAGEAVPDQWKGIAFVLGGKMVTTSGARITRPEARMAIVEVLVFRPRGFELDFPVNNGYVKEIDLLYSRMRAKPAP